MKKNTRWEALITSFQEASLFDYTQIIFELGKEYYYSSLQPKRALLTEGMVINHDFPVQGIGYSIFSKEIAKQRATEDVFKKLCLTAYPGDSIYHATLSEVDHRATTLPLIHAHSIDKKISLGWVEGRDVFTGKTVLLPAQAIYLHYLQLNKKERVFTPPLPVSAGAGFSHEEALLDGIYDLIAQDASMTVYLGRITPPKILLSSIPSARIRSEIDELKKLSVSTTIVELTHDLAVPVFCTILTSTVATIPDVSVGVSAHRTSEQALVESFEKALLHFSAALYDLQKRNNQPHIVDTTLIASDYDRLFYWSKIAPSAYKFLLQGAEKLFVATPPVSSAVSLPQIEDRLHKLNYALFFADITLPRLKKHGLLAYKPVIPQLQLAYPFEQRKQILAARVRKIGGFYGKKIKDINTIPHPFI